MFVFPPESCVLTPGGMRSANHSTNGKASHGRADATGSPDQLHVIQPNTYGLVFDLERSQLMPARLDRDRRYSCACGKTKRNSYFEGHDRTARHRLRSLDLRSSAFVLAAVADGLDIGGGDLGFVQLVARLERRGQVVFHEWAVSARIRLFQRVGLRAQVTGGCAGTRQRCSPRGERRRDGRPRRQRGRWSFQSRDRGCRAW